MAHGLVLEYPALEMRTLIRTHRGFTLIEIAVVLVIVAIMLSMAVSLLKVFTVSRQSAATNNAFQLTESALVTFVTINRRLPCPASAPTGDGLEQRDGATGDCLNSQQDGVVPWTTLRIGIGDVTDGYQGLLTYRVGLGLSRDDAMNFTTCDPGGNAAAIGGAAPYQSCAPLFNPVSNPTGCQGGSALTTPPADVSSTCTKPTLVLAGRGILVSDASGTLINNPGATPGTGAAYVLVSHGANQSGGYMAQGGAQGSVGTVGAQEANNVATAPYGAGTTFVDRAYDGTDTATHFDDIVSHPAIMQLATRAGTGPRVHQ